MVVEEIKLGRKPETLVGLLVKGLIALSVLWIVLFMLPGCDGELDRLQAQAEFRERFTNAALPKVGEPTVCEVVEDKIVCHSLKSKRQPVVVGYIWESL